MTDEDPSANIYAHEVAGAAVGAAVCVSGYVANIRKYKSAIFIDLRDLTGKAQVVIEAPSFSDRDWKAAQRLRKMLRIKASGIIGPTKSGTMSVICTAIPSINGDVTGAVEDLDADLYKHANKFLLARMRAICTGALNARRFIEIETSVLSTRWPQHGLEGLRVVYPGFGSSVSLAISPATQLLDFMSATGSNRVFSVSKCFTTTYRIDSASAEALIVVARALDLTFDEHVKLLLHLVDAVLKGVVPEQSRPAFRVGNTTLTKVDQLIPVRGGSKETLLEVAFPEEEVSDEDWDRTVQAVVRLVCPGGLVVAEGAVELLEGRVRLSTVVIHLEQLLSLVQATPARRLRDLGNFNLWDLGYGT